MIHIRQLLKRYHYVSWALVDQAMVSGVNFLIGLLLARFLGISAFGVFTLAWMVVLFVNSIQMAMISAPMMTVGPQQLKENEDAYYNTLFFQQIIFSTISSLCVLIGVFFIDLFQPTMEVLSFAVPLVATVFVVQIQDFIRRIFFVRDRQKNAVLIDAVNYIGQVFVLAMLIFCSYLSISTALWGMFFSSVISVLVGVWLLGGVAWKKNMLQPVFLQHWKISKWMVGSTLMQWVSGNFFVLAAGVLLGTSAVGAIKVAQSLVGVVNVVVQGMENFLPSRAAREFTNKGVLGLNLFINKILIYLGGVVGCVFALMAIFSKILLITLYGEQYASFDSVLRMMALVGFVGFSIVPVGAALRVLENTKAVFISFIFSSAFSLLCAYPMVDNFGLPGVLAGLLISKIIPACTMYYYYRQSARAVC